MPPTPDSTEPSDKRQEKTDIISPANHAESDPLQPSSLYPTLSTHPDTPVPVEIKAANLKDAIDDVNTTRQTEAAVKDEEVAEPTEQHVLLLEQVDLEAPSPYREPLADEDLDGTVSGTALVAPARKKGRKKEREKAQSASIIPPAPPVHVVTDLPIDTAKDDVKWWLYLAEVCGRWGDRMWSFTSALFLLELFPGSMLLPAIHGFITGLCVILFGALIGEWVDRTTRLTAVRIALITQNSAVAIGSFILTMAFVFKDSISDSDKLGCVFGFLFFAIIGDCASVAMNIIVEKDWVVVIAGGSKSDLADMNATIRRIDLTCQILSPIIIAQIMTFGAHYIGTIVVSLWNIASMAVEYFILLKIYTQRPQLALKTAKLDAKSSPERPLVRKVFRSCFAIRDGWQHYLRNRVAPAGLGLAFLYMTVLSFSGVTNTYVRTQGLSESVLSIMMAVGAVTGIAGTFVFPTMRRRCGLERTGLYALALQLACLALCVVSIWLPGSPFDPHFVAETRRNSTWLELAREERNSTGIDSGRWITRPAAELPSVIVFMFGMIGARFGLWMADLTITQLIQENVAEKERGVIGGVQSSLNRFMDMLKFILVICLPYPETFGILIILSILFVFGGDCFYAYYSYKTRGHLLPHCGPAPTSNGQLETLDRPNIVLSHRDIVPSAV